jgi:fumarate hydratase class II
MLADNLERLEDALKGVYRLAIGGTAVGTGLNSASGFDQASAAEIARLTGLPFVSAPNKFTVQGAHDALVQLITHSIALMADSCTNFSKFLVVGTKPNLKKIKAYVEDSLMLVTALSPVIGYDKTSKIAHYANDNDLTLRAAALKLGYVGAAEFDRVVDPKKMVTTYVAGSHDD